MAESIAQIDDDTLRTIVQRLVAAVHPDRIILFGSRARGDAGPDSDYDLLVVAPSQEPLRNRTVPLYRALRGIDRSIDVVWCTQEEIADRHMLPTHFITTVVGEGEVVYGHAA